MKERNKSVISSKSRYQKCYLAIALPGEFKPDFADLITEIKALTPKFRAANSKTPHITLLRMGELKNYEKIMVEIAIGQRMSKLWGKELSIGGFGVFIDPDSRNPDNLYLEVSELPELFECHSLLKQDLSSYINTVRYYPFHPHMTLGYVANDEKAQVLFKAKNRDLKELLNSVSWNFQLEEITLFGKDKAYTPCYTKPLRMFSPPTHFRTQVLTNQIFDGHQQVFPQNF